MISTGLKHTSELTVTKAVTAIESGPALQEDIIQPNSVWKKDRLI